MTSTYDYDAFGNLLDDSATLETSYLYTGQQYDSLTELYSLRARYYDPSQGRFLSQDRYCVAHFQKLLPCSTCSCYLASVRRG